MSQSSFHLLSDTDYSIIEYEIVPGYRQNSKLLFSNDQFYVLNTKCPLGDSYVCVHEKCKVRVYGQCIRLTNSPNHEHENKAEEYKKLRCLNEIKRRCGELNYLLTGQKITVRDIFNQVLVE